MWIWSVFKQTSEKYLKIHGIKHKSAKQSGKCRKRGKLEKSSWVRSFTGQQQVLKALRENEKKKTWLILQWGWDLSNLDTPQNRQNILLQIFSNNSDGVVDLKGTEKD